MGMLRGTRRGFCSWLLVVLWISLPSFAAGPADYELMIQQKNSGITFEEKPWIEMEALLPRPPEQSSLVLINVGPVSNNKFEIDEMSVTYGADEVIRYTLVVTSSSGVRNVSYEGMRCSTGERRLYAFGRSDGGWAKARNDAWVRIQENKLNRHHAALYKEYFCTTGGSVMDTVEARRVLRSGNPAAVNRP
jgi:CNP1-like family